MTEYNLDFTQIHPEYYYCHKCNNWTVNMICKTCNEELNRAFYSGEYTDGPCIPLQVIKDEDI